MNIEFSCVQRIKKMLNGLINQESKLSAFIALRNHEL